MFRRKIKILDFILAFVFLSLFTCFLLSSRDIFHRFHPTVHENLQLLQDDEFDISLLRVNSMDKLISYCDSFYEAGYPTQTYPGIVSEVIRKKFYRGYSFYNIDNNVIGVILEPLVKRGATAIVIPDDILKYPTASCSQQSIVGMEVFKRKGYNVRKITMFDTITNVGHFAYEVHYDSSWHFFDTNEEPDRQVLKKYNRPSTAFLAANPTIILEAYRSKKDPELFKRLLMSYKAGPVNVFPAPNASLYQTVTKWLSYYGWILILGIILFRYSILHRRNKRQVMTGERKITYASFSNT